MLDSRERRTSKFPEQRGGCSFPSICTLEEVVGHLWRPTHWSAVEDIEAYTEYAYSDKKADEDEDDDTVRSICGSVDHSKIGDAECDLETGQTKHEEWSSRVVIL